MPKKSRRARGTGAIFYSQSLGRWVGRVLIGNRLNGQPHYRQVSAPSQGELLKKLNDLKPPGPTTTVAEWGARWLESVNVRPATATSYATTVNKWVVPSLGTIQMTKLTTFQIDAVVKKWRQKLADVSVKTRLLHLRTMLQSAIRANLIAVNPASASKYPRPGKPDIDPFSVDELKKIITTAVAEEVYPIALIASIGCRRGEAIALELSDYDPIAGVISITKQLGEHGIGPPKTENGIRDLKIPRELQAMLERLPPKRKYLLPNRKGKPWGTSYLNVCWKRLIKQIGLRYRNIHQLRHSVATAMISANPPVPPPDIAKYLGDTVDTIVKTYIHPSGVDPSETMDHLLSDCKVTSKTSEKRKRLEK